MKSLKEIIKENSNGLTKNEKKAVEVLTKFAVIGDLFEILTDTRGQLPEKIVKDYLRQFTYREFQEHYMNSNVEDKDL